MFLHRGYWVEREFAACQHLEARKPRNSLRHQTCAANTSSLPRPHKKHSCVVAAMARAGALLLRYWLMALWQRLGLQARQSASHGVVMSNQSPGERRPGIAAAPLCGSLPCSRRSNPRRLLQGGQHPGVAPESQLNGLAYLPTCNTERFFHAEATK